MLPAIVIIGALLRLAHNTALMRSPLYVVPIGGHRVFLETARLIAAGDLLPGNRPFTENSPLLPYLYALFDLLSGENLLFFRFAGIAADCVTIVLIAKLGTALFERSAGLAAALLYSIYGPAVVFSTELIYIPFTIPLLTGALLMLAGEEKRPFTAGVLLGLSALLMPTLLAVAPLVALAAAEPAARNRALRVLAGTLLTVLPATAANYINSGQVVLLTTSAGHNFYIGHNPMAQAGYFLPDTIDGRQLLGRGSIFEEMKQLAEQREGHSLRDAEVSGYYFELGLKHLAAHPGEELKLAVSRTEAFVNDAEPLTYTNYAYERAYSPVLNALPRFPLLFALTLGSIAVIRPRLFALRLLGAPIAGSLLTCLVFFVLARFRFVAVPAVAVFAGAGTVEWVARCRQRDFRRVALGLLLAGFGWWFAQRQISIEDSSNEWNKEGGVLLKLNKFEDAESAFRRAQSANPGSPNAYQNLARLYSILGREVEAAEMTRQAEERLRNQAAADYVR